MTFNENLKERWAAADKLSNSRANNEQWAVYMASRAPEGLTVKANDPNLNRHYKKDNHGNTALAVFPVKLEKQIAKYGWVRASRPASRPAEVEAVAEAPKPRKKSNADDAA